MKRVIYIALFLFTFDCTAQNQNNIWCWGDSAAIDFNSGPTPSFSVIRSRGSSASVADTSGQLLFYSAYDTTSLISGTDPVNIYNKNHVVMANGDSMKGGGWYHEQIIIQDPSANNLFYFFYIGVTFDFGLYYAKVDMSQNGGLGQVIIKNVQLQSFKQVDCLSAVKHGNGRDWWIVFRKYEQAVWNNDFYTYLVTPLGISNVNVQSVGTIFHTGFAKISFSPNEEKMMFTDYGDLIELYDFDRCTGVISNPRTINPEATGSIYYRTWGSEFSPSGDLLYISTSDTVSYLYQYNLSDTNPQATRDTLWQTSYPRYAGGDLKRGPDGKIYFSCAYDNGLTFNYPYPDSMYNMYNMYLGVINQPDSLGAACDFQPYSFYLGGKRTYWGLPNNPDYDMPALAGSPCDTLTGLTPGPSPKERGAELFVTWVGSWQKLFVNAQKLKGKKVTVEVFDVAGKNLTPGPSPKERGEVHSGYFTKDIFLPNLSAGVYVVKLQTEKEMLAKKFVVSE